MIERFYIYDMKLLSNPTELFTFAAMSFEPTFYYSNNTTRENFTSPVFFNAISLQGSEKVLTHTHTHRHLASPNLFLRARRSYANLRKHKGYSYLWCYVFRTLSATDIRENKERFYLQNLHDFRAVNCHTSININSHAGWRPSHPLTPLATTINKAITK